MTNRDANILRTTDLLRRDPAASAAERENARRRLCETIDRLMAGFFPESR